MTLYIWLRNCLLMLNWYPFGIFRDSISFLYLLLYSTVCIKYVFYMYVSVRSNNNIPKNLLLFFIFLYSTDLMKVDDHTSYLYDACDYLLEISEIAFNNWILRSLAHVFCINYLDSMNSWLSFGNRKFLLTNMSINNISISLA